VDVRGFLKPALPEDRDDRDDRAGHRCLLNAERDTLDGFLEIGEFLTEDRAAGPVVGVIGYCSQRTT
jgi:hypothetical protein